MKKIYFSLIIILCFSKNSHSQSWSWAVNAGCYDSINVNFHANADGTYFYYGGFRGSLTLGSQTFQSQQSGWDLFFSKFDAAHQCLWAKSFGGSDNNTVLGAEQIDLNVNNAGNIILAGSFADTMIINADTLISARQWQDAFLAECDSMGNFLWIRHLSARAAENFSKPMFDGSNIIVSGGYSDYDPIDTLIWMNHEVPTDTFIIPFILIKEFRMLKQNVLKCLKNRNHGRAFVVQ